MIKAIVLLLLAAIIISLGSAMVFLVRDKPDSDRMVKSLTIRVGLSIVLVVLLLLGVVTGVIHPHAPF